MATWIAAVRHPQKEDDLDGIHRGDTSLITEEGQKQARTLVTRALHMDIDAIISSDSPRTALLATQVGKAIGRPVEVNPLFREWRVPSFMEGRSTWTDLDVKEAKRLFRESFDRDVQHFDEETKSQIETRTKEASEALIAYPAKRVLLVTHAKFICGLITQTIWGNLDGFYRGPDRSIKLDNTGVTVFAYEPDRRDGSQRLVVKTVNDVSHYETEFYNGLLGILQPQHE